MFSKDHQPVVQEGQGQVQQGLPRQDQEVVYVEARDEKGNLCARASAGQTLGSNEPMGLLLDVSQDSAKSQEMFPGFSSEPLGQHKPQQEPVQQQPILSVRPSNVPAKPQPEADLYSPKTQQEASKTMPRISPTVDLLLPKSSKKLTSSPSTKEVRRRSQASSPSLSRDVEQVHYFRSARARKSTATATRRLRTRASC